VQPKSVKYTTENYNENIIIVYLGHRFNGETFVFVSRLSKKKKKASAKMFISVHLYQKNITYPNLLNSSLIYILILSFLIVNFLVIEPSRT